MIPDVRDIGELAEHVIRAASERLRTLATAESLTGGLLGATLTAVPGASLVYRGGVITYASDLKHSLGGVPLAVLARHGAVARPTAEALAEAAAFTCTADLGVALTGVAGPAGQEGHPAGTVWLGWWNGRCGSQLLRLTGDRAAIRDGAVRAALGRILCLL